MSREKLLAMMLVGVSTLGNLSMAEQAQNKPAAPAKKIAIRAGHLIDGKSDKVMDNAVILIEGDSIVSVTANGEAPAGMELIDLSQFTVLPGFADMHTHVVLNGDITAEDYDAQLLKQSIPYRAILGARNARIALDHGFTIDSRSGNGRRDVCRRGRENRDRQRRSSRAAHAGRNARDDSDGNVSTAGLLVGAEVPTGVEYVDGVEGARKAVREQMMYGADWIKYYSDRKYHFETDGVLHSMVNFTDEEAKAIVDESHRLGQKSRRARNRLRRSSGGVARGSGFVEHGDGLTDALMDEIVKTWHVLGADDHSGSLCCAGKRRKLDADGGPRENCVSKSAEEKRKDCFWNGRGRIRLERSEPVEGI